MHTTVSKGEIDAHRGILYYSYTKLLPRTQCCIWPGARTTTKCLWRRIRCSCSSAVYLRCMQAAAKTGVMQRRLDTRNGLQKSTQQWNLPLASLSANQFYCEAYTTCREVFSLHIIDCQREHQSSFYHPRAAFIAFVFLHRRHKNTHAHET